ncbi:MAG: hypothetical protein GF331_06035 [Chitinivibrionales bacterium]|nr:hypothetical protein [Chitinivibrionales bacterium]
MCCVISVLVAHLLIQTPSYDEEGETKQSDLRGTGVPMHKRMPAVTIMVALFLWAQAASAVEGLVLYTRALSGSSYTGPGELHLSVLDTNAILLPPLIIDTDVLSAQFSPDCEQVAYVRLRNGYEQIVVADLDGANQRVIKDSIPHPSDVRWCVYLCWRLADKILYSYDRRYDVHAIDPVSGDTSVYYTAQVGFSKVSVSTDGTRMTVRSRTSPDGPYNIDMAAGTETHIASGCSNWISPDGLLLTHCTGGWQNYAIRRFDGTVYKSYSVPGQTHLHHWSHNSNEWIIYQRSADIKMRLWANIWIQNIETDEDIQLTFHTRYNDTGRDFWVGDIGQVVRRDSTAPSTPAGLQAIDSSGGSIAVSWSTSHDAESAVRLYNVYLGDSLAMRVFDTVATIAGLEPLTSYTVSVSAVNAWGVESAPCSPIAVSTTDRQVPVNTLFIAAQDGALHNGMSTATEAGSLAPTAVYGTDGSTAGPQESDSKVALTVTIPADGVWYAWGRFSFVDGQANSFWLQVDSLPAQRFGNGEDRLGVWHWEGYMNEGHLNLGSLSAGQHTLTVYCREPAVSCLLDVLCLTMDPTYVPQDSDVDPGQFTNKLIRLDSPNGGETFHVGDTITVRWSVRAPDLQLVDVSFSPDEGETWTILNTDESIGIGAPEWGNYTWVIPSSIAGRQIAGSSTCLMRVGEYEAVADEYIDISDACFTVLPAMAAEGAPAVQSVRPAIAVRSGPLASLVIHVNACGPYQLRVHAVNGAVVWQRAGIDEHVVTATVPGAGVYLLRLRTAADTHTHLVRVIR